MGTLRAGSRGLRSVFGPSSQQLSWSRVPQRSVPAQGLLVQALGAPGPTAEACRAAVTPVCTTDALDGQKRGVKVGHGTTGPTAHTQPWGWGWGWGGSTDLAVGTAGPASKTVSAAGIVVVAEAPFPTRHVAHTGQVGGREGRVLLLLTCSGLHVAGVASRAAVLAVLTAHGLGEERCYTPLPPPPPRPRKLAPWQFGSLLGSWPPAGHSRGAAGSRPSPCSGSGSRSAPPGNWCAGHSPWCFRAGTRKPGGWASCSVRSPCPSSSYSVPCRHTCGPWGSSTGGPSSRQPGDVAEKGGLGSSWGQNTEPLPPPPRLSCSQLFPPGMTLSQRGPPVGQAEGRRQGNRSLAVCPAKMLFRHPLVLPLPRHLWGRTAAPLSRRDWTAGTGGGTAGDVITGDISLHG